MNFLHVCEKKSSPHLNIVLTLPYKNETYNALLEHHLLHQARCETLSSSSTEKQIDSHKVC